MAQQYKDPGKVRAARARWANTTAEQRGEYARRIVRARWDRTPAEQRSEQMRAVSHARRPRDAGQQDGGPAAA